jgi:hypothetical protein
MSNASRILLDSIRMEQFVFENVRRNTLFETIVFNHEYTNAIGFMYAHMLIYVSIGCSLLDENSCFMFDCFIF